MFRNIGKKVMGLAKFLAIVSIIAGVVACVALIANDMIWYGCYALLAGIVVFLTSFLVYAFGQIADDIHKIAGTVDKGTADIMPNAFRETVSVSNGASYPVDTGDLTPEAFAALTAAMAKALNKDVGRFIIRKVEKV